MTLSTLHRLLIVFFTLCLFESSWSQKYNFLNVSEENKWDRKYIYAIDQLPNRILLLGTESGISSFDGINFTDLHENDDRIVSSLEVLNDSVYFVGYFNGDIEIVTHGIPNLIHEASGKVLSFVHHEADTYVLISGNGLYKIEENLLEQYVFPDIEQEKIISVVALNHETFVVATYDGSFLYYPSQQLATKLSNQSSDEVYYNKWRKKNNYLIGYSDENDLIVYDIGQDEPKLLTDISLQNIPSEIQDVEFKDKTELWIASKNDGLYKLSFFDETLASYSITGYRISNGLESDQIKSLFVDEQKNLWIGTYGQGLSILKDESIYLVNRINQFELGKVTAIIGKDNDLFIGTERGLYKADFSLNTKVEKIQLTAPQDTIVTAIANDKFKNTWVVTSTDNVYRIKSDLSIDHINSIYDINIKNVNSITTNPNNGNVYLASDFGLFYYNFDNDNFIQITTNEGLVHNVINHVELDKNGRIWFSPNNSALFSYFGDEYTIHKDILGLSDYNIRKTHAYRNDIIVLGTESDGALFIKDTTILKLNQSNGLYANTVYDIVSRADHELLIISKKGINILDSTLKFNKEYGPEQLYNCDFQNNASYVDQSGKAWLGTDNGILIINQTQNEKTLPPKIALTNVEWDGKSVSRIPGYSKYGKHSLKISFIGIDHVNPTQVTYAYKLKGYETNWNYVGNGQKIASYQRLYDGEYTFMVKAVLPNGLESEVVEMTFKIGIPFWKTIWFLILVPFALILIVYLSVWWRINSLRKQKLALEEKVRQRTTELRHERDNLKVAKHEIEVKNKEITDSIKYAERIQQARLDSDMINQLNVKESFLLYSPSHIVSGDFYWFDQRNNHSVMVIADCTGHGVPGAFMSMMTSTLLDKIIIERGILEAKEIVRQLDEGIVEALHGPESSAKDGADVGVIVLNNELNTMDYCGASRPLYQVRDGELKIFKGGMFSVGEKANREKKEFQNHLIKLNPDDQFYISTDGFTDQFGGPKNKKYMIGRFKKLLLRLSQTNFENQQDEITNELMSWKGSHDQTDDILVFGFKV